MSAPDRARESIPGPKGLRKFTAAIRLRDEPIEFLNEMKAAYGDLIALRVGLERLLILSNPAHIKQVLVDDAASYRKPRRFAKFLAPVIGNGLSVSEGELWQRQRRLTQPIFHRAQHLDHVASVAAIAADLVPRWLSFARSGEPFDVASEMTIFTMRVVSHLFFGVDVGGTADELRALNATLNHFVIKQVFSLFPIPLSWPLPGHGIVKRAIARLDEMVYGILSERREAGRERADLVGKLLAARDVENGQSMSEKQMRDEMLNFFIAGHDTTACTMAWMFYLLARHPAEAERARAEIARVLPDREVRAQDLGQLSVCTSVMEETLRLYPQAYVFGREAVVDTTLGGHPVKRGTQLLIAPILTHRDPAYWDQPDAFIPARFDPTTKKERSKFVYYPFGGGQRQCIGSNLAMMVGNVALATLLPRFHFELAADGEIGTTATFVLGPRGGVPMRVTTT
jgi:cytochrome P450